MRFTLGITGITGIVRIVLIGGLAAGAAAQQRTDRPDERRGVTRQPEQEQATVRELLEDLQSANPHAVVAAIRSLGDLRAREAIPALIEVFGRQRELSRWVVPAGMPITFPAFAEELGTALLKMGPPGAVALARFFHRCEPEVRRSVLTALRSLGPAAIDAVPVLKDSLALTGPEELVALVEILGGIGAKARVVVPDLLEFLAGESGLLRAAAALALVRIERRPSFALLVRLFDLTDEPVFRAAAKGLLEVGEAAVPEYVGALAHESADVRNRAAFVLGRIGRRPDLALAPLAAATGGKDSHVALAAGDALVAFGACAVPVIEPMLTGGSVATRYHAVMMLARIGPAAADVLIRALEAEARDVRVEAARVFAKSEEPPAAAIPALARGLGRADPEWNLESLRALARLGPKARDALPAVTKLLDDPNPALRARACVAAARISAVPPTAELIAAASDEGPEIRAFALATLTKTAASTPETLRTLLAALSDRDATVRREAVSALRSWAADSAAAREALQLATEDSDRIVRWRAMAALR